MAIAIFPNEVTVVNFVRVVIRGQVLADQYIPLRFVALSKFFHNRVRVSLIMRPTLP